MRVAVFDGEGENVKAKALDQIDTNLEQIVMKLTESGQIGAEHGAGSLNPLEFDSLKLAQDTLGLLRRERKTQKR